MEILSDATFKGKVIINEGLFIGDNATEFSVIKGYTTVFNQLGFHSSDSGNTRISKWSDLNNILDFAPSSLSSDVGCLSTTVSSNTCKINTACSTISSLQTTIYGLPRLGSVALGFDVPADCTKFFIGVGRLAGNPSYMVMTKGVNPMSVVNVDLEMRCDSTTNNGPAFVATKSSGFEMKASDNYVLKYFY